MEAPEALISLNAKTGVPIPTFGENGVASIDSDSNGHLWVVNSEVNSANGALFDFDPATNQWIPYTVGNELPWFAPWKSLSSVHVGINGHVFVANAVLPGFAEFDGTAWTFHDAGSQFSGILQAPETFQNVSTFFERYRIVRR